MNYNQILIEIAQSSFYLNPLTKETLLVLHRFLSHFLAISSQIPTHSQSSFATNTKIHYK